MTRNPARIAFIGLGTMGAPMARNLARAGFDLSLCDINPEVYAAFRADGFQISTNPAEAAHACDVVFSILPNSGIVENVLLGPDGAAHTAAPRALFVEMSTGSSSAFDKQVERLCTMGLRVVDSPVGRSKQDAEAANALFMAGGAPEDLEQIRPMLEAMGSTIVYTGPIGTGLRTKLVNNYMAMINHVLTGEVLAFAERVGLNRDMVVDVLSTTSAGKGQLLTNFPKKVLKGDVTPDFPITMGIKDLNVALELADGVGESADFGRLAKAIFEQAADGGFADLDCTAVLNFLSQNNVVSKYR